MDYPLDPPLLELRRELRQATEEVRRLVDSTDRSTWAQAPGPHRWSVAECVVHLNLTSEAYLPLLQHAVGQGRQKGHSGGRYGYDLTGRLLRWLIEPPVRIGVKTKPPFVPTGPMVKESVKAEFVAFQEQLEAQLSDANGLDLTALKVLSPFSSLIRYNVFSAFKILTAHQRRHVWQARRALETLGA
jgi:hypothetical protein